MGAKNAAALGEFFRALITSLLPMLLAVAQLALEGALRFLFASIRRHFCAVARRGASIASAYRRAWVCLNISASSRRPRLRWSLGFSRSSSAVIYKRLP